MKLLLYNLLAFLLIFPCLGIADFLDALIMVQAGDGVGTGFIVKEENQIFLYTNTHVIEGGSQIVAKKLSGEKLSLGTLYLANNRDLAKFLLDKDEPSAFTLEKELPAMHSSIKILGNSDGSGVVTHLEGKVLGVGPELIEVDAKFIQGNSGSPILSEAGTVLGVATFVTKYADEKNWVKKDSRFNEVRRYGVRLEGVEWVEMKLEDFQKRAGLLADLSEMMDQIYRAFYTNSYLNASQTELIYPLSRERAKFKNYPAFARDMNEYCTHLNTAWAWIKSAKRGAYTHNTSSKQQDQRDAIREMNMSLMMFNQNVGAFNRQSTLLKNKVHKMILHDYWGTEYFKDKAREIYRVSNILLKEIEQ